MSSRFRIVARFALALWSAAAAQNAWAADADPAQSRAAFNRLYQQVLADPTNVELNLRYAEMAAKRGDLEAAIGALERLLVSQPYQREVQLRVGLLYARLKSYDMAKAYLEPLVTAEDVPPELKSEAADALRLVNGLSSRHQFSGLLFVGAQTQSNPGAAPASANFLIGGIQQPTGGVTKEHDSDLVARGAGDYAYDLGNAYRDAIEVHGSTYSSLFQHESRLDLDLAQLTVGPRFGLERIGIAGGDISPYAVASYVQLGNAPYYVGYGAGLNYRQRLGDGWPRLTLGYEAQQADYSASADYPTAGLLTGRVDRVALGASQPFGDLGSVGVTGLYTRQNARASFYANGDLAVEASLTLGYGAAWSPFGYPMVTTMSAGRHLIQYDAADPSVSPTTVRTDRRWQFLAEQVVPVTNRLAIALQLYRDVASSNIVNYSYTNTALLVGLQFGL